MEVKADWEITSDTLPPSKTEGVSERPYGSLMSASGMGKGIIQIGADATRARKQEACVLL